MWRLGSERKRRRYLGMRSTPSFHSRHSATEQHILEIRGSKIDLSSQSRSQGATRRTLHFKGHARCSLTSLATRGVQLSVTFTAPAPSHHYWGLSMRTCGAACAPLVRNTMGYDEDGGTTGCWNLCSLSGVSFGLFTVPLSCVFSPFFISGFGSVVHLLLHFVICLFLTARSTCSRSRCFLLSCATSLISISFALPFRTYLSLHHAYDCLSITVQPAIFFYTCL